MAATQGKKNKIVVRDGISKRKKKKIFEVVARLLKNCRFQN